MATRCPGCMKMKENSPVCEHCGFDESVTNASHQLPMGTLLKDQYRIGKVLGQGGFGITYLGWDEYLDIPLAIKEYYPNGLVMRDCTAGLDVISCEGEGSSRFVNNKERFMREAKMLARFSQMPQIVQVKNFFLDNNTAYIAMEYVEGTTLKQYVKQNGGKITAEKVLAILKPVLEALGKVHHTGLIHRDISPDNIMMLPNGGAKLLDFGAGRDVSSAMVGQHLTSSTESILKPGYAPIEQYQKRGNLGPWTDVYALCGTVYYCLTGEVPPDAPERMLEYGEGGLFDEIPGLEPQQREALNHGMAIRTEQRTASVEDLYRELFAPKPEPIPVVLPEPEKKPEPKPKPEEKKETAEKQKKQKQGIPPMVIAAVIVCCIVALAFGLTSGSEEGTQVVIGTKSGTCGESVQWTFDPQTGVLALEGSGEMTDYLPSEEALTNADLPPWYGYRAKILSVSFNGITNVGSYAFGGCSSLTEVTLGDSVTDIGAGAFSQTALTEFEVPYQVETIGAQAFDRCQELTSLTIYRDTAISYDALSGPLVTDAYGNASGNVTIHGFTKTLAEDYASIFDYRFEKKAEAYWDAEGRCGNQLTWHLDFETGLLKISGSGNMYDFNAHWQDKKWENGFRGNRTFAPWADYADKIRILSIGDNVTSIGENAFCDCNDLRDVYFGKNLQKIGAYAFHTCGIDKILLPDSVTQISPCAFTWCASLEYVQLPLHLEVLEENTFYNCRYLKQLFVGADTILRDETSTPFDEISSPGIPGDLVIYSLPGSDAERFCGDYNFPEFKAGYWGYEIEQHGQCGDHVTWMLSGDTLLLGGSGATWLYQITQEERDDWAERDWPKEWLQEGRPEFYEYRDRIHRVIILPGLEQLSHRVLADLQNLKFIDFGTVRETHMALPGTGLEYVRIPETMEIVGEWCFAWSESLRIVEIEGGSEWVGTGVFDSCPNLEEVRFGADAKVSIEEELFTPEPGSIVSQNLVLYVTENSEAEAYAQAVGLTYRHP